MEGVTLSDTANPSEESNPQEASSLQKGHELVKAGYPYAALNHFRDVAMRQPVTHETVVALQTLGMAYRNIRQLTPAIEYLEKALTEVQSIKDSQLEASILKDLEETRNAVKPRRITRSRKDS